MQEKYKYKTIWSNTSETHLIDILRYTVHLIGPGHFGSLSQNHRRLFEFLLQENVSEKTQEEEEEEEEKTLYHSNRECQRQRRMRELLYGTLSLMPTRSRRSGGNPQYAFILVTGAELRLIFRRTPPLLFHLLRGATRRKTFLGYK